MHPRFTRKFAIATAVLAAAALGGGAYAATQSAQPHGPQAFLRDVASRLHVSTAQLQSALHGAFDDQLNAAVAAHRLTRAQADALAKRGAGWGGLLRFAPAFQLAGPPPPAPPRIYKARPPAFLPRIYNGRPPAPPFPGPIAFPGPFMLVRVAHDLGLAPRTLFGEIHSGKTLAQIATAQGKSPAQLEHAIDADVQARLDRLVTAKVMTSAEEKAALARSSARVAKLMHAKLPGPRPGPGFMPWPIP